MGRTSLNSRNTNNRSHKISHFFMKELKELKIFALRSKSERLLIRIPYCGFLSENTHDYIPIAVNDGAFMIDSVSATSLTSADTKS